MKKMTAAILVLCVLLLLGGCSKDTYTEKSTSKNFKLKNVVEITLAGPGESIGEDITVSLNSSSGMAFTELITLVTGKKLDTLPEDHSFGLCKIVYTTAYDETVSVYPATDGSNYIKLFSMSESNTKYIELSEQSMNTVRDSLNKNGIQTSF